MIVAFLFLFLFAFAVYLILKPSKKRSSTRNQSSTVFTNKNTYQHDKWLEERAAKTAVKIEKFKQSFDRGFTNASGDRYARYIFMDFETTDLPIDYTMPTIDFLDSYPYIVQAAILVFNEKQELIADYSSIIKPPPHAKFAPAAVNIHKISKSKAESEGSDIMVMFKFIQQHITGSSVFIAHNIKFDGFLLKLEAKRNNIKLPRFKKYCTMKETTQMCAIYKNYGSGYKYPNLKELVFHTFTDGQTGDLNLNFHDAFTDIKLCAMCFFELKLYEDLDKAG